MILGLVVGMDTSNAKRNQETGIAVLKHALQTLGVAPKREFTTVKEFTDYFTKEEELIFDGIEQHKQRPSHKEEQKSLYSGKKNITA